MRGFLLRLAAVGLLAIAPLAACTPAANDAASKAAIGAAVEEYMHEHAPDVKFNVVVERIEGDYARMRLIPEEPVTDAATGYAHREGPAWKVLGVGTAFEPAFYERSGVPTDLREPAMAAPGSPAPALASERPTPS